MDKNRINCTCIVCHEEIESDDNFCHNCGHWTPKGYTFLENKNNVKQIMKGEVYKQDKKFRILVSLLGISIITFAVMILIRGNDMFKPFALLKKQINSYIYGYNSSVLKTNNVYNNENINTLEEAKDLIRKDIFSQSWLCSNDVDVGMLEYKLENNYNIPSVSFCDMSLDESIKITNVIEKMYQLFPNISGALTNITITNANTKDEYIAYFQPMYQFVNTNQDINLYNKVNKTQILLNSYYFLNEKIIATPIEEIVGENWYVKDANWESTIAHELGHYISFLILLKSNDLDNITLVTLSNYEQINKILEIFDNNIFSKSLIDEALYNYNLKYNTNYSIDEFALSISKYANVKDKQGNLIADETIAEAVHDYFLHGDNCNKSSYEIIKIIKSRL